nr:G5P family DNA-binding protein [Solimonas marina]
MKIEVVGFEEREVVSKKTGEIMRFKEVNAYVHGCAKYPFAIKFDVAKGGNPPAPGMYELDPSNFYAGDFGKLSVRGQLILKPVLSSSKAA